MASIEIRVEGEGSTDLESIELPEGITLQEVVTVFAGRRGFAAEQALLFVEGGHEPVDVTLVVEPAASEPVYHVHRARNVEVTVSYQNEAVHAAFPPSTPVQRVLHWAVGQPKFNIDPEIAPEMELALHGTQSALPKTAHIGRYVHHPEHTLHLDLIRGVVPNGSGDA